MRISTRRAFCKTRIAIAFSSSLSLIDLLAFPCFFTALLFYSRYPPHVPDCMSGGIAPPLDPAYAQALAQDVARNPYGAAAQVSESDEMNWVQPEREGGTEEGQKDCACTCNLMALHLTRCICIGCVTFVFQSPTIPQKKQGHINAMPTPRTAKQGTYEWERGR